MRCNETKLNSIQCNATTRQDKDTNERIYFVRCACVGVCVCVPSFESLWIALALAVLLHSPTLHSAQKPHRSISDRILSFLFLVMAGPFRSRSFWVFFCFAQHFALQPIHATRHEHHTNTNTTPHHTHNTYIQCTTQTITSGTLESSKRLPRPCFRASRDSRETNSSSSTRSRRTSCGSSRRG